VEAPTLGHPQPIPVAVWVGDVLHSSPIGPRRADGTIPAELGTQLEVTFENLGLLLDSAGAARDAVGFVNVQLADPDDRKAFNDHWTRFFADDPRPARQVSRVELPPGVRILLTVTAYR
jgi:enamine deaminase RidA (YjgF/YER057c/UK114 family)